MKFKSEVQLEALNNATVDTDKFLVSDSSTVKYRTGAQVLSDIGGQAALTNPITGTGTLNYVSKFTSATSLGNSQIFDNGTNVGIGTASPAGKLNALGDIIAGSFTYTTGVNLQNRTAKSLLYISTDGVNNAIGSTITYSWVDGGQGPLKFNNTSGEVMRLDAIGKLGVGTTNPTSRIHSETSASGPVSYENRCAIFGYNTATETTFNNGVGIAGRVLTSGGRAVYGDATTGGGWGGYFDGKGYFSANVGIGTTVPDTLLHISSLNSSILRLESTNTALGLDAVVGEIQFEANDASGSGTGVKAKIGAYSDVAAGNAVGLRFFTGDAGFTTGTEKIRILANGNVGIGTTAPVDKLDVNGAMRFRANTPSFTAVTNSGVIDFVPTTVFPTDPQIRFCAVGTATVGASMVFQTGTTSASIGEVMRITSTGNVGIGTTVPAVRLNVAGGDAAFDFGGFGNIPAAKLLRAGDEPTLRFYRPSGGTPNARIFQIQNTVGDLTFGYALANKYSESTFTEAMRITSTGNVGIGTTAPVRALQVGGFSGNPEICIGSGTTGFGSLTFGDGASGNDPWRGFVQYNHATDAMIIGTANAGWLTLTNGGALGLNVNPTNTAGRFEASNDIVAYSSSDKRWKTNIKNIDSPLEKISQINGVEFDWIEDEPVHGNKGHDIGVIAQEIEKILPDAVQTRESGMKAVKYEKVIPLLIEAVKEQQKQIEELKQIVNGFTK